MPWEHTSSLCSLKMSVIFSRNNVGISTPAAFTTASIELIKFINIYICHIQVTKYSHSAIRVILCQINCVPASASQILIKLQKGKHTQNMTCRFWEIAFESFGLYCTVLCCFNRGKFKYYNPMICHVDSWPWNWKSYQLKYVQYQMWHEGTLAFSPLKHTVKPKLFTQWILEFHQDLWGSDRNFQNTGWFDTE